jgi:RecA/RadA recombinase
MPSAAALRIQIESALEHRYPAALTPLERTIRETAPTCIPQVDALLNGGLPVGVISEITGPESSGRTSLALACLAGHTAGGRVCARVDACDAFDAESAAASGVRLRQLLWVRCRSALPTAKPSSCLDQALCATDLLLQAGGFAALVLGQDAFAQSSAAVVLECAPLAALAASQTVLDGYNYQVRSGRQRFTPSINGPRKPPASTWSATSAWEREKSA